MMKRKSPIDWPLVIAFVLLLSACGKGPRGERDERAVKLDAVQDRVAWAVIAEPLDDGQWKFSFRAEIDPGWSVYSTQNFGDLGPWPSSFGFDSLAHVQVREGTQEVSEHTSEGHDPVFDMSVRKFKEQVDFVRMVDLADAELPVSGWFEYMTCNDEMCLPPATVYFMANPDSGTFQLSSVPFDLSKYAVVSCNDGVYRLATVNLDEPAVKGQRVLEKNSSLWTLFFLGFVGGLLALLTPCVFPMIPLTVSFFTKGSEDRAKGMRNALTYGSFILLIYLIFSIPFHVLGSVNEEIFNEISTNPWLNLFFFVIFIVFAISFFGYFEITLPSSWVNRMDANASKFGGFIGIFFMALTLALVSFSCTGPILGSLLAGALTAEGGAWQLTAGMGGFGLALALPFALFAMFPQWLNSLPRSGSWLNTVKVVLGFIELALAIKFLSNADLVMNWGLLKRELFIGLWIVVGIGLAFYLFGLIRFPHDSPVKKLPPLRLLLGVLTSAFVLYLLPGVTNGPWRNLKFLSGFPPPLFYSYYHQEAECPLGLVCHHSIEDGMRASAASSKPMMLDYTGWACVNCRKMEETVWAEPDILTLLQNYELVSLYVDDKRQLPAEEQHVYISCRGQKKLIRTEGNRWATLQSETFGSVSQPLYVLLSPDGKLLTDPVGYTPDKAEYARFLERGLQGMQVLGQQVSR
jgi:thiol:disulfide interchange protein